MEKKEESTKHFIEILNSLKKCSTNKIREGYHPKDLGFAFLAEYTKIMILLIIVEFDVIDERHKSKVKNKYLKICSTAFDNLYESVQKVASKNIRNKKNGKNTQVK